MRTRIRGALAGLLAVSLCVLSFSGAGHTYTFSLTENAIHSSVTARVSEGIGTAYLDQRESTGTSSDQWYAWASTELQSSLYADAYASTDISAYGDGASMVSISHSYSEYAYLAEHQATDPASYAYFSKAEFGNQSTGSHTFTILGGSGPVNTTIAVDEWAYGDPVYPNGGGFTIRNSVGDVVWNWNVGSGVFQSDALFTAGEVYSIDTSFGHYWRGVSVNHSPGEEFVGPAFDDRFYSTYLDISVAGDPDTPPGPDPNPVPEPLSVLLLGLGLGCLTIRKYHS